MRVLNSPSVLLFHQMHYPWNGRVRVGRWWEGLLFLCGDISVEGAILILTISFETTATQKSLGMTTQET